jgi:opacity protein-like surface antigen
MRALKISLLAGALLLPVAAQAADIEPVVPDSEAMGLYLRADAGASFLEWSGGDDDVGGVFGGGIGYRYNDNFRTDLTVDWAGKYDVAPGASMSTLTVLGNLYYDFANDTAFTPYIGAGAGVGFVSNTPLAGDEVGLAVNLTAGVAVDLTDNLALDVSYRFRDTFIKYDNPLEHQITAGLRFSF